MKNIIIVDKSKFEKILEKIKQDGVDNFHILSDFDKTLTKAFVDGKKRPSIISVLRSQNILGEDYSKKAYKLFDYYHAIEINPKIEIEEKKKQMTIWWQKHLKLIVDNGLNKKDIEKVIKLSDIEFRKGAKVFLKNLNKYNIPLIIISANGLGGDSNQLFLEKNKVNFKNINIISNKFIWDKKDFVIGYKKPVIHVFNKDETVLREFPEIYKKVKNRKNVILLGDSLGDPAMVKGFAYKNLIKIGFLNDKEKELLEEYKKIYDIIVLNDGDFSIVNEKLKYIIN